MKLTTVALFVGLLLLVAGVAVQGRQAAGGVGAVLEFEKMAPVTGPFVGPANPIRGVAGGGFPWVIASAKGELKADGKLEVRVRGLVLDNHPVQGNTNPSATFRAIVSCLTISDGAVATVNVSTGNFPATATGDAKIEEQVSLPSPCVAPIVFVGPPQAPGAAPRWFAVTGIQ